MEISHAGKFENYILVLVPICYNHYLIHAWCKLTLHTCMMQINTFYMHAWCKLKYKKLVSCRYRKRSLTFRAYRSIRLRFLHQLFILRFVQYLNTTYTHRTLFISLFRSYLAVRLNVFCHVEKCSGRTKVFFFRSFSLHNILRLRFKNYILRMSHICAKVYKSILLWLNHSIACVTMRKIATKIACVNGPLRRQTQRRRPSKQNNCLCKTKRTD